MAHAVLFVFEHGPLSIPLGRIGDQPVLAQCYRCAIDGITQMAIAAYHGFAGPDGPELALITDAAGRTHHGFLCDLHAAEELGRIRGHAH